MGSDIGRVARKGSQMNKDLKAMTDAQLDAEAKALKGLIWTASQARNARAVIRYNRQIEAVWREIDRRKEAR